MFVHEVGTGSPLVLLHGLLVSGEMFAPLLPLWSARHRLIVPDLPAPRPVRQLAAEVADLLDRLDVPRADVLGYSQGGTVAQQLARDRPDRVDRLVLVGSYAYNRHTRRERVEGWLSGVLLATAGPAALTGLIARGSGGPRLSPAQTAALHRMLAANTRRTAVAAHRAMLAFDSRGWLAEITAATLVVRGSADAAVPRWHADMLVSGIPRAELRTIDGAGHLLAMTHPVELAQIVETWLTRA